MEGKTFRTNSVIIASNVHIFFTANLLGRSSISHAMHEATPLNGRDITPNSHSLSVADGIQDRPDCKAYYLII